VRELLGDPVRLAPEQFRLAMDLCGSCRDYHALWPYRRLSGIANGFEADATLLEGVLREVTPAKGRILIAGAADAGLLALTWGATEQLSPAITVADRCATPLAICQAFARARGLSIDTLQQDLPAADLNKRYDVIFAHSIVQFVAPDLRRPLLQRLGAALTDKGSLVLAERLRPPGADAQRHVHYADDTLRELAAAGIVLPEEEAAFRQRFDADIASRSKRLSRALEAADLTSYLRDAGLHVARCEDHALRRRLTAKDGGRADITIQIAIARRAA
jgi:hypothetical protein